MHDFAGYFGGYTVCRDWLPVRGSGDYYRVGFCEETIQGQNMTPRRPNNIFNFYAYYDAPATLNGTIYLIRDPIDYTKASRQAWIYNAGQRRVRLTGVFGYATPPRRFVRGQVALARQIYRADATTPGGMAGPDEWAGGAMPRGWPDDAFRGVVEFYRHKFGGCWV